MRYMPDSDTEGPNRSNPTLVGTPVPFRGMEPRFPGLTSTTLPHHLAQHRLVQGSYWLSLPSQLLSSIESERELSRLEIDGVEIEKLMATQCGIAGERCVGYWREAPLNCHV